MELRAWFELRSVQLVSSSLIFRLSRCSCSIGLTGFCSTDLKLSKSSIGRGDGFSVSVTVHNGGAVEAKEVVQVYLTDVQSSVVTPNQFLAGFEKVSIP